MFRLRRPGRPALEAELASLETAAFSYPEVGASREEPLRIAADVYDVDRYAVELGRGRALFERAVSAVMHWKHFELPWIERVGPADAREGAVTGVLMQGLGLWSFNPCRVVYVLEAGEGVQRAGFAYGTLRGHAACGEERFAVEIDPETERVRFEILAFSRAASAITRVGRPYVRGVQRRFGQASLDALQRAVG